MAKVIDWKDLIDRLEDENLILEIVPEFLENDNEYLEQIASAINSDDAEQLQITAHTLKGAAATVGAVALSEKAKALELIAEELKLDQAESIIEEIKVELDKVRDLLSKPNWAEIVKADT